ncbi:class F sortase [Cellulomonas wangsupingiae]|uniref:Class F sortase n=2 Tax=Cellulomonas wangsupingiae TaxID=2968085 RepID=A0ABY5K7R3_9CELL|nr:class F sortase [Cellulomonas wangsupingiae]UUI66496.1 class F sortase [Cellulomonas wangsupingiae]
MPAPAPARTGGPVRMAASVPVRLQIPAIGVDSELMRLGLQDDGTLEVPPAGFPAGWYDGAPTPGELGPAVIAGHVDWASGPGVFYELANLAVGDEIRVTRTDGTAPVFQVTAVEEHPKDQFPTDAVYGDIDHAGLRLITCGGEWDRTVRHYEANVVVFAELVRPG